MYDSFPSLDEFKGYTDNIKNLEDEIRAVELHAKRIIDETQCYSHVIKTDAYIYEMEEYLKATSAICDSLSRLSDTLNYTLEEHSFCISPDFFDFIVDFDIGNWWEKAYPVIVQIASITGAVTGTAAIATAPVAFIKWLRNKLQSKQKKNEYTWIKFILSKDEWNISALSEELGLSANEVKGILKGFGYRWSAEKMLYVSTEETQKLRDIDNR